MIGRKGNDERYLSLCIAVVDCVDEAVDTKGIAKLWCELGASLGSVRFGEIDDGEISEIHLADRSEQEGVTWMGTYDPAVSEAGRCNEDIRAE